MHQALAAGCRAQPLLCGDRAPSGGGANPYFCSVIRKPNIKRLADAVRAAEVELDAAKGRTATNAAAKKLMRAKEELKAAEQAIRPASGAVASAASS